MSTAASKLTSGSPVVGVEKIYDTSIIHGHSGTSALVLSMVWMATLVATHTTTI